MPGYKKGADAERELIHILYSKGFAVVRTAGSGKTTLPAPDLIALSNEKKIAFECKAWKGNYLNIAIAQIEELKKWGGMAGAELYIAWKVPRKGWLFIPLKLLQKKDKNFTITRKKAQNKGLDLNVILGKQARIKV